MHHQTSPVPPVPPVAQASRSTSGRPCPAGAFFALLAIALLTAGCSGDTAVAPIVPTAPSTGLRFQVDSYAVRVGQVTPLAAVLTDARGRTLNPAKISWSSSEPAVAAVSNDGVSVGVSPGTAWIVASSGAQSARVRMDVSPVPVASVTFQDSPSELVNGSSVQLRAIPRDSSGGALSGRPVSYATSDSSVATISASGLLQAVGVGAVSVSASSELHRAELTLRVVARPVASVELEPSSLSLEIGGSAQLRVIMRDADGGELASRPVNFHSSNGSVAMVDAAGMVRAVAAGNAAVVVEVEGRSASASVSVRALPDEPTYSPGAPSPPPGPPTTLPPPPPVGGTGSGGFTIDVRFVGPTDERAVAVIGRAAARWTAAISGDLPSAILTMPAGSCHEGQLATTEVIDDVLILVRVVDIDGPGKVLARAGPCFIRAESGLPLVGVIELDRADLGLNQQIILDVVTHEMGHVLGIGTLWSLRSLVHDREGDDPLFMGAAAQAAYQDMGGSSALVPLENTGGAGTRGSHWREATFRTELMTGWINGGGPNPLSRLTIGSLRDLGYQVNMGAADPYTLPTSAGVTMRMVGATGVAMHDELFAPRFTVDSAGRTRRIR